jgi:hypothetical protein
MQPPAKKMYLKEMYLIVSKVKVKSLGGGPLSRASNILGFVQIALSRPFVMVYAVSGGRDSCGMSSKSSRFI